MKPRTLSKVLRRAIKTFPAIVVTGPRQSGKTTLLKALFLKTHRFVSLENLDMRRYAKEDPVGFLNYYAPPVILDEIQYVPELLSYIKTRIDENRRPGQWLLTGSQNFVLMEKVTQSLAGRAAVLSLLPFSYAERIGKGVEALAIAPWLKKNRSNPKKNKNEPCASIPELILRGHYPEIANKPSIDLSLWFSSYISTYLERDVRSLANIGDLTLFERFLKVCAIRTGQILNLSEIARDLGIAVPTVRRWLSILESSYIIYQLAPYYRNLGKRLIKSQKLYFLDTGLASHLMGIQDVNMLIHSPHFGPLFETFIVTDVLKRFLHHGDMPSMYYLRTRDGLESDLVIENGLQLHLFEIKSTSTIFPRHASSLKKLKSDLKDSIQTLGILSNAASSPVTSGILNWRWNEMLRI